VVVVVVIKVVAMIVLVPVLLVALFTTLGSATLFHVLLVSNHMLGRFTTLAFPRMHIFRVVFTRLHEIHLPVAGVILATVQPPRASVLRRNVQVKRLRDHNMWRRLLNDHRLRVDQSRRRMTAEIHAPVHAGSDLTVYRDSDVHIGMSNGGAQRESSHRPYAICILHNQSFSPQKILRWKVVERIAALE
jgi:hypothetical protein